MRDFLVKHPSDSAWSDVQRKVIDAEYVVAAAKTTETALSTLLGERLQSLLDCLLSLFSFGNNNNDDHTDSLTLLPTSAPMKITPTDVCHGAHRDTKDH